MRFKCRPLSTIAAEITASETNYNLRSQVKFAIMIAPILIAVVQTLFMFNITTRYLSLRMLDENYPVELLTFIVFLFGGVFGLKFAYKNKRNGEKFLVYGFYNIFSVGLIFIAMEEIAWGQWLFKFETPEAWRAVNLQGETTLHNIYGLQGHSEILRLTYGVCGLIGVWLSFYPTFRKIGVPAILLPWFIVIVLHASVDVFNDIIPINRRFDYLMQRTSELVELMISISALLYLQLNARMCMSR